MFTVMYLDDLNRKHITVAQNMMELKFIRDRFEIISYDLIDKREVVNVE